MAQGTHPSSLLTPAARDAELLTWEGAVTQSASLNSNFSLR